MSRVVLTKKEEKKENGKKDLSGVQLGLFILLATVLSFAMGFLPGLGVMAGLTWLAWRAF